MENINKSEDLNAFRAEFAARQKAEQKAKDEKKPTTGHFLPESGIIFNPAELTEDDEKIWEKYKNGTLDEEAYNAYFSKLKSDPQKTDSRMLFQAFIANMVQEIILLEHFKKNS